MLLPLFLAAHAALAPIALGRETPLPPPWHFSRNHPATDDYAAGLTDADRHGGATCGFVKSGLRKPVGWGDVNQGVDAAAYRGKRVRLRAWLKTLSVHGEALAWMRVDGKDDRILAHDGMYDRRVTGTTPWTRYDVVLDVAPDAERVLFGVELQGEGALLFDDLALEVVDASVPLTYGTRRDAPARLDLER